MADGAADALEEAIREKDDLYKRLVDAQRRAKESEDPAERMEQARRAKILRAMYNESLERLERLRPPQKKRRRAQPKKVLHADATTWDFFERCGAVWADLDGYTWNTLGKLQAEASASGARILAALIKTGMETLTDKQRYYIQKCFGEQKTLGQVALAEGVSRSTVCRCVKAGLRRLEGTVVANLYALQCIEGDRFDHLRWAAATGALTERQREMLYYLLTDDANMGRIARAIDRTVSTVSRTNSRIAGRLAAINDAIPGQRPARVSHLRDWSRRSEDEIAEELGISPGVYYRIICRDRPVGPLPRLSYEIVRRHRAGMTAGAIARELEINRATAAKHIRQYGHVDTDALSAPRPYRPANVRRAARPEPRNLLSSAEDYAGAEGTIGAAVSAEIYRRMLAISREHG